MDRLDEGVMEEAFGGGTALAMLKDKQMAMDRQLRVFEERGKELEKEENLKSKEIMEARCLLAHLEYREKMALHTVQTCRQKLESLRADSKDAEAEAKLEESRLESILRNRDDIVALIRKDIADNKEYKKSTAQYWSVERTRVNQLEKTMTELSSDDELAILIVDMRRSVQSLERENHDLCVTSDLAKEMNAKLRHGNEELKRQLEDIVNCNMKETNFIENVLENAKAALSGIIFKEQAVEREYMQAKASCQETEKKIDAANNRILAIKAKLYNSKKGISSNA